MNFFAQCVGYASIACFFLGLVLISLSDRKPNELDGSDTVLPEAKDAERPALPKAIIVHLSVSDRINRATPEERAALRRGLQKIRDREKVEALIREVSEGI